MARREEIMWQEEKSEGSIQFQRLGVQACGAKMAPVATRIGHVRILGIRLATCWSKFFEFVAKTDFGNVFWALLEMLSVLNTWCQKRTITHSKQGKGSPAVDPEDNS